MESKLLAFLMIRLYGTGCRAKELEIVSIQATHEPRGVE